VDIVRSGRLDLEVIAVGGVASAEDAADFFSAGAHAVMMGSAPMYDPSLAGRMTRAHPEW
jgi:dihydroorotate dehydrogenase